MSQIIYQGYLRNKIMFTLWGLVSFLPNTSHGETKTDDKKNKTAQFKIQNMHC